MNLAQQFRNVAEKYSSFIKKRSKKEYSNRARGLSSEIILIDKDFKTVFYYNLFKVCSGISNILKIMEKTQPLKFRQNSTFQSHVSDPSSNINSWASPLRGLQTI